MNINFKLYVSALFRKLSLIVFLSFTSFPAFADVNNGDTAWILTSTALVLFMTLPGLALFYAGLVNSKNVVSVLMQHFAVACVVSIIWVTLGYSLAFSSGNAWIGDLSNIFMKSIDLDSTFRHYTRKSFCNISNDLCYYHSSFNYRSLSLKG
jgi:ammonia channel protein AmtB